MVEVKQAGVVPSTRGVCLSRRERAMGEAMGTKEIPDRLRDAGAWTKEPYFAVTPTGSDRDSGPFEAADDLAMQGRELETLAQRP